MAVATTLNSTYTKPADAIASAKSSYQSGSIGQTDRGTAIVEQNSGMNQNTFLKLLVAQMTNMDPTQDQDSTAYVSQMAQFASIEQMNNLNTTMKDFAYEQMVGKVAILNELDSDGYNKYGLITQIVKNGSSTTATILDTKTGAYENYDIKKIIGTSDSGYTTANFETALNSNFISAASLAKDNATGVYVETSTDTKTELVNGQNQATTTTTKTAQKCTIKNAYLDKQNSVVKVTIELENGETKTVNYSTIAVAGKELDEDVINQAIKDNTTETTATQAVTNETSNLDNSKASVNTSNQSTGSSASSVINSAINNEMNSLNNIIK